MGLLAQAAAAEWDTRIREKQTEIDTLVAQAQQQQLTLTEEALGRIQQQIEPLNVDLDLVLDEANRAMTRLGETAQEQINAVLETLGNPVLSPKELRPFPAA